MKNLLTKIKTFQYKHFLWYIRLFFQIYFYQIYKTKQYFGQKEVAYARKRIPAYGFSFLSN